MADTITSIIRFNTSGNFDVRNGTAYGASSINAVRADCSVAARKEFENDLMNYRAIGY